MSLSIKGKVHEIGEEQQVTDSFRKRELIVEYAEDPRFVEYIKFESHQDRVSIFDGLQTQDEVEISFNLRGRPWTNKEGITQYFTTLVAWKVTKTSQSAQPAQPAQPMPQSSDNWGAPPAPLSASGDDDDQLPF